MTQLTTPAETGRGLNADGRRRLKQVFAMVLVYAVCLFVPAGSLRWVNAWAYLLLFVGSILTAGVYVMRRNPDIVNERGRASEKTKPFDRRFGRVMIPLVLGLYVIAGLDFRFGWSDVPRWLQIMSFLFVIPSAFMPFWVMLVNSYAATTVRIETERGQQVITSGPYRYVRHPMYSTNILANVFIGPALGSWWAMIPAALVIVLFVWRTAREDQALRDELPGYVDYAARTRYRLLPGVW